ncbi:MAG: hypothetical protein KatS3mg108_0885 [Isosphaeraceae bacterium]|jgi:Flp pilus assembly protein TadD|nr:MAG: hypothetical protein KatS3mg108_0885 [Isosphaeraceae bacterium]
MPPNPRPASIRRLQRKLAEIEGYLMLNLPQRALDALNAQSWTGLTYPASVLTGEALRQLGRPREALEHLERAAAQRPLTPELAIALGWCYKRTHRLALAIETLETARRLHPDEPLLAYNLACYWSLAGNASHALACLQTALNLKPELLDHIPEEADFNPIRQHPGFVQLTQRPTAAPEIA